VPARGVGGDQGRSPTFQVGGPPWTPSRQPPTSPSSQPRRPRRSFARSSRGSTEDGKRIQRLLVKSPPGLGKTREAIASAVHHQAEQEGKGLLSLQRGDFNEAGVTAQTAIFVPRHQLAVELKEVIECAFRGRGEPISVPIPARSRERRRGGERALPEVARGGRAGAQRAPQARALRSHRGER
jgi:hypothetical protein